ncbi:MAG: AAA family ATPase, partial [Chloroflexota bacterium]|nr:AAA family ATPase [Chloroflexota bacterium]
DVLELLDGAETRLVTLTGPGGVGKTRLALAVARRAERGFADGVAFLPLAATNDTDMIVPALAQELQVDPAGRRQPVEQLADTLVGRHLLLVLDNVEHLLSEPPAWLVVLLERCPRLKVLVTSRVALNISGEHRYLVSPLPVVAIEDGEQPAAVELFAHRA